MLQSRYCLTLLILITMIFLSSCKKEQTDFYIPGDFKAWSCYKTGSYWVYLNEKTGKQDCTWVKSDTNYIQIGYRDDDQDPIQYFEVFQTFLSGDLYTSYYTGASGSDNNGNGYTTIQLVPREFEGINYSPGQLQNPKFSRNVYRETIENYGVAAVYQEETVNSNSFSNVYDIRHEWFSQNLHNYGDSLIACIHLVKNIGIIKLRKYKEGADTTWSLLRWKVVQ
jgi:hypothetical protein